MSSKKECKHNRLTVVEQNKVWLCEDCKSFLNESDIPHKVDEMIKGVMSGKEILTIDFSRVKSSKEVIKKDKIINWLVGGISDIAEQVDRGAATVLENEIKELATKILEEVEQELSTREPVVDKVLDILTRLMKNEDYRVSMRPDHQYPATHPLQKKGLQQGYRLGLQDAYSVISSELKDLSKLSEKGK